MMFFFSQSQWCVCVTHVYHYSWDSHSTGQRRKKHRRVREQPRAPASPKRTDDVVDISSSEEDRAVGGGDLGEVAAAAAHWARVREDEGIVVYDEGRIQKKNKFHWHHVLCMLKMSTVMLIIVCIMLCLALYICHEAFWKHFLQVICKIVYANMCIDI